VWAKQGGRKLPVRMIGFPYLTLLGAVLLAGLMITTWFTDFKILLQFGIPWLLLLGIAYFFLARRNKGVDFKEESKKSANEQFK
jgi:L-asparagine transporter-like permease